MSALDLFIQEDYMTLQSTSEKTLRNAMKYIQDNIDEGDCNALFVKPKYPIFDGVSERKLMHSWLYS